MAVANFSMPFQPVTVSPFFYPGNFQVNSLQLNAVLPPASEPEYDDEDSLRISPYTGQYRHQQQQRTQRQRQSNQYLRGSAQTSSSQSFYSQNVGSGRNYNQNLQTNGQTQGQGQSKTVKLRTESVQSNAPPANVVQPSQYDVHTTTSSSATGFQEDYPGRPTGYTKVNSGFSGSGAKTSLHAILDYDDDDENIEDYYDDDQKLPYDGNVTPIQGPISLKNGKVPVVPLYSYPQMNNGTLVQIPLLWTALSVALGIELRGDLVKGIPCIKKNHQLYCPTAGNSYPIDRIEQFIDENKALIKRMYGEFEINSDHNPPTRKRRMTAEDDLPDGGPRLRSTLDAEHTGDSYFSHIRKTRQDTKNYNVNTETGRTDVCESKIEIVTPYWSRNSAGKLRAVVNTQHFEQAIHQEVCTKSRTNRCSGDCGCEQKYKWHRLLAYDPDNDCKGIFMDWFLFPSCCVCRCDPKDKKTDNKK